MFPGRRLLYLQRLLYSSPPFNTTSICFTHKRERAFWFCVGAARVFTKAKTEFNNKRRYNDLVSAQLLLSVLLSELQCVVCKAIDETKWYYFIHQLCEHDCVDVYKRSNGKTNDRGEMVERERAHGEQHNNVTAYIYDRKKRTCSEDNWQGVCTQTNVLGQQEAMDLCVCLLHSK